MHNAHQIGYTVLSNPSKTLSEIRLASLFLCASCNKTRAAPFVKSHIKDSVKKSSTEAHFHTLLRLENPSTSHVLAFITAMQRWGRVSVLYQR